MLAGRFGARTATLVAAVTNPGWDPDRDKHEQYREHGLASLAASPWARVIKAPDFTGNTVGIIHTTRPKLSKLTRKHGPWCQRRARSSCARTPRWTPASRT